MLVVEPISVLSHISVLSCVGGSRKSQGRSYHTLNVSFFIFKTRILIMKTVHYFANQNRWVAVCPGQFSETITYCQKADGSTLFSSINLEQGSFLGPEYYERIENDYCASNHEIHIQMRLLALAELVSFVGDSEEYITPTTRPDFVERGGILIPNDLPF